MKYKFHEQPPDIQDDEEEERNFLQEIHFISDYLGIDKSRIKISADHPCGEDVIFIDGAYNGYLDNKFYDFMISGVDLYGDFQFWKEDFENKLK